MAPCIIINSHELDVPGGRDMRTTISIPDDIYAAAKEVLGARSFSELATEAIRNRVEQLKRERLAREMAEGYRAEALSPSLDEEWAGVETESL
jgi:predicted CopG family antitoxin